MNLTYHDEIVGTIRPSIKEDCVTIARNMRKQDAIEMWSYDRSSPLQACLSSFNKSLICMTIEHEGTPIAMFGVLTVNMSSGILWMLTTDGLEANNFGRPFVRNCKRWFNAMLEIYPLLYGMVDVRNEKSIKWLTYIGATWGENIISGIDNVPFKPFKFLRKE